MTTQSPDTQGRRERNKQDKLARITDAACKLFAERGIDGVTTQQVAQAADVATGDGGFYRVYTPFWNAVRGRAVAAPLPAPARAASARPARSASSAPIPASSPTPPRRSTTAGRSRPQTAPQTHTPSPQDLSWTAP